MIDITEFRKKLSPTLRILGNPQYEAITCLAKNKWDLSSAIPCLPLQGSHIDNLLQKDLRLSQMLRQEMENDGKHPNHDQ